MIGLHTELNVKMQDVTSTTSDGTLLFLMICRERHTTQVGRKHNRNTAMLMLTSKASFLSVLLRLESSCCIKMTIRSKSIVIVLG